MASLFRSQPVSAYPVFGSDAVRSGPPGPPPHARRSSTALPLSMITAKMGAFVLDFCSGSGDLAFLLSEKVGSNGKVIGLDFLKEQLSIASSRQKLKSKACCLNIEWVEGDATDLPFSDRHFDAITMGYGLRNVVDKYKAMEEMFRVLKAGSILSLSIDDDVVLGRSLFSHFSSALQARGYQSLISIKAPIQLCLQFSGFWFWT
ncbi:2-phytyl-1,4-beta-naphthoquinone methyltransferase, chloroplastic-like isoform X3 [Malus domestica]|uniref:2-phytyl-1,4-beta-naphthoquinone methyltransferase, chloroplastic-like isoform X3 n=1 Tax=Malus domestica TaxID=3750 RepID=UPI0004988C9C|nr:2-phytyl-1,4-beta-naphthoquinone methyltransferase, chloroplastic-like isoform X3 [Malus domestica]